MTGAEPTADRAGDGGAAGGGATDGGAADGGVASGGAADEASGGAADEAGLPATVAAAWGVRERPHKGPKPALSLARIVSAAVRVADAEGLGAVSMGRVAAELDAAPMSLYRHVAGKDELRTLMVDAAWGEPPDGTLSDGALSDRALTDRALTDGALSDGALSDRDGPGEGWRAGLARWAWALRTAARRHPWVVRIPLNSLPILPNEVGWFELALACMRDTGLTEARKASVIMLLAGYVRNLATTEADIAAAIQASGLTPVEWMSSYPRILAGLADPQRFPALTQFIAAGVFEAEDGPDDEFIFGLDRILDGLEALIGAGATGDVINDAAR
jgi:AcrR family transcriptional regulator